MEKRISTQRIYEGKIMALRVDTVVTSSGRLTTREILERPRVVSVLPLDDQGNVILVRQFRYAVGRETLEIPAGVVAEGETPLAAARRELREETGFDAASFRELVSYRPAIGFSTEHMTIFLAKSLIYAPEKGDEENIRVERIPFGQLYDMVVRGDSPLDDAKSIVAILLARARGEA
ncbi:MAG: NUDIX hydrolase [Firmicutes bacterium]|nr:NUDIX hydrolase [Candidatus Fermentithermobacillaceae bacterium]